VRDGAIETTHDYEVFGLRVRSEIVLPELLPAHAGSEPDVTIRAGSVVAPSDTSPGLQVHDGGLVLLIPEVGRYRIEGGKAITVDAAPGVPDRNVRLYLLGSVFGAMLHQRGLLPLHANAVEIGRKAAAFMGPSGEGKSTLAAWFHDHGHRLVADDVCVVRFDGEGKALALPGMSRLRLWQDVLEASGRRTEDYQRSYANDESWNKFDVPIDHAADAARPVPIAALYVLRHSDEFGFRKLDGIEAADAVFANTYRGSYVTAAKGEQSHWLASVALVRSTPVFELSRPRGLELMDGDCARIIDHVRALA
jgi:hypothetical protein